MEEVGSVGDAKTADGPATTAGGGVRRALATAAPGVLVLLILALVGITYDDAWTDEAASIASTTQFRAVLHNTSGTMAAYYFLLNGWIRVSDALWWLRFLSVLFAVGGLLVTAAVGARYRGTSTARWACLLLGSSYMLVNYAREARSFAMVVFVVGAGWLALDHIVEGGRHRNRWMLLHLGTSALAPLTHGLAVIAVLGQLVAVLAARAPWAVWWRVVTGHLASLFVVVSLYRMGASEVGVGPELGYEAAKKIVLRLNGGDHWREITWFDPRTVILAFTVYGLALALGRWARATDPVSRFRAVAPAVWAVTPIAGLFALGMVRPTLVDRYAIAAIPALALLQADAALHAQRTIVRLVKAPVRWAAVPAVPMLLAAVFLVGLVPMNEQRDRTWSTAVDVLATRADDGDGLLVPLNPGRMMLDYAWSQHDGPLPELFPVAPTHPLGRVQRYGSRLDVDRAAERTEDLDRLWVLEVPVGGRDSEFQKAVFHPELRSRFELVETFELTSANLYLLERR